MLTIKFLPDSDLSDYSEAVKEYDNIWSSDGERIIKVLTEITGCQFMETFVNAIVYGFKSVSHPLALRYSIPSDRKRSTLIHELGHRLLNHYVRQPDTLDRHKGLFLILYDAFVDIYGEDFAKESVGWDSKLGPMYKEAWEWALKFSKAERNKKFREMLNEGKVTQKRA